MKRHYDALDAVRFVAAFVVVLHHDSTPAWFGQIFESIYKSVVFGPAAVAVFFIVSGFCIHGPYVDAPPPKWGAYFARRYIRIGLPFLAILIPSYWLGVSYHPYTGFITWSLICEMAYYTLYPILRPAWQRLGWVPVMLASYAVAYWALRIPGVFNVTDTALYALTSLRDILHNLPIWLLGCLLADLAARYRSAQVGAWIWPSRALLVATVFVTGWLHYQHGVHLLYSLPIAAPIFALCIWCEIHMTTAPTFLVGAGHWSFSLYLVHPLALYGVMPHLQMFKNTTYWAVGIVMCLVVSYAFYLLVERPSHRLARRVHDWIAAMGNSPVLPMPSR